VAHLAQRFDGAPEVAVRRFASDANRRDNGAGIVLNGFKLAFTRK
jgi:hypothetical protein